MYYITDDSVSVANFSQLTTYKNEDDSTLKFSRLYGIQQLTMITKIKISVQIMQFYRQGAGHQMN